MVEVGRRGEGASPPKTILCLKRSCSERYLTPTQKMGAAGCGGGLGRTGERAYPSRCPARSGHNRKGPKPQVQVVNLYKCLGRGGGDSGVTDVPSGTGRGCLGSGGKPTGLLRQKGGWRYWCRTCVFRDGWGFATVGLEGNC